MRKKRISLFILAAMLVSNLAGCSSKDSSSTSSGESGKKVEVTYALWDTVQAPVFEELAQQFEEQNPNIDIKIEITPWAQYWTKLETSATGGNAPDVFWLNIPNSREYIDNGILLPIDDISFEKDKYPQGAVEAFSADGKLYGVPKDIDTQAIWYNKTLFDQAGVEYPNENWGWGDLKEAAKKLTNTEEGIYGIAAPIVWQGGYYDAILQNEGEIFSENGTKSGFDNPKTIEAVEYWSSFMKEGYSPTTEQLATTKSSDYLMNGKLAMLISGPYMCGKFFEDQFGKDNIDVGALPKGKVNATVSNSLANVVYAKTDTPEESKKWVEFLATKEANEFVAKSGVVIPTYMGSQDAWAEAYPDKNIKVFVDQIPYAVPLPNYENASVAAKLEEEILLKAWTGEMTVEEACLKIAEEVNKILQK